MMLIQALALFILDCFDMLPTAKVRLCLEVTIFFFLFYHETNGFGDILLTSGLDAQSNTGYIPCCIALLSNHGIYTTSVK